MESQQRKPYVKPSVRPSTPDEITRFQEPEPERDTWPAHAVPTFVCAGCSRELPGVGEELTTTDEDFGIGALCGECSKVAR